MLNLTFETASRLISLFKREGVIELLSLRHARIDGPALQRRCGWRTNVRLAAGAAAAGCGRRLRIPA